MSDVLSLKDLMTMETGRSISFYRDAWENVLNISEKYDLYELQTRYPIEKMADELATDLQFAEKKGIEASSICSDEYFEEMAKKYEIPMEFTDKEMKVGKTLPRIETERAGYIQDALARSSLRKEAIQKKIKKFDDFYIRNFDKLEWKNPICQENSEALLVQLDNKGLVHWKRDEVGTSYRYDLKENGEDVFLAASIDRDGKVTSFREDGSIKKVHDPHNKECSDIYYRKDETIERTVNSRGDQLHYDKTGKNVLWAEDENGTLLYTIDENRTKTTYSNGTQIASIERADGYREEYGKDFFTGRKELEVTNVDGSVEKYDGWKKAKDKQISFRDAQGNKKWFEEGVLARVYDAQQELTTTYHSDGKTIASVYDHKEDRISYYRTDKTLDTVEEVYDTMSGRSRVIKRYDVDGKNVSWGAVIDRDKLYLVKDAKGNELNFDKFGNLEEAKDINGNIFTYNTETGKTLSCNHAELGAIEYFNDGTFYVRTDEGFLNYSEKGKLLSYANQQYNVVYKDDGKTVDHIDQKMWDSEKQQRYLAKVDLDSEQGKAILEGLDEVRTSYAPKVESYCQSNKNLQELCIHVQQGYNDYRTLDENRRFLKSEKEDLQMLVESVEKKSETQTVKTAEKQAVKLTEQSVENQASKTAIKTAEQTAEKQALKTATRTTLKTQAKTAAKKVGNTLLEANAAYDKFFDETMERCIKLNESMPQWMQRGCNAVDKAMAKPFNNKVTKASAKKLEQAAEAFAKTKTGQKLAEKFAASALKVGGKDVAKSLAKKIPLVCLAAACYFAAERSKDGESAKAQAEIISGICGCVPGVGTVASLGIDGTMLADDLKVAMGGESSFEEFFAHGVIASNPDENMVAAESTFVKTPMDIKVRKDKFDSKVDENVKKAATREAKKTQKQAVDNIVGSVPWAKYVKNQKSK